MVVTTPYDHIQNYFVDYRLRHALSVVSALKRDVPRAVIAVAGAHGSVRPDIVLADSLADYVLRGEMDVAALALAQTVFDAATPSVEIVGRGDPLPPPNAEGAVTPFKLVDLGARYRTKAVVDPELRPAYDLIDLSPYFGDRYDGVHYRQGSGWATALATRGCAHDCGFCFNFWGRQVRYRDAEAVVEELAWLDRDHGVRDLFFLDFNFVQDPKWVSRFCQSLRRKGLGLTWSAQTRCDNIGGAILEEMAAAGCRSLWLGVESFSAAVGASMAKYADHDVAVASVEACRAVGITPQLFVMIGAPGETRASLNETIGQMHRLKAAYCGVMPTTPRFGTPLYAKAKQQFPLLGDDFYSLRGVRGLVDNDLTPADLRETLRILNDRDFVNQPQPALLSL